ncbi:tyrosine-type recombinase/integrase [uncultured Nostoc sp.]|uniref:tyrosine-type recombinase/integrase n=1 Tax=uncultured Nostoc sp. TaxID=340711 RepID=UPI0035CA6D26
MKSSGNGQAKVLNPSEISRLFTELSNNPRNACLFAICFFTGCRISEARQLLTSDIKEETIIFRKNITKGKLRTRSIAISPALRRYLDNYQPLKPGPLFPGRHGVSEFISRNTADRILRNACKSVEIQGVSTHSLRRSALTYMHRSGIPLRTIQKISGHGDLGTLQLYLEVSDDEIKSAINSLNF